MLRSIPFAIVVILHLHTHLLAQDAVYSQYGASPTLLNPAYTGHIEASYRLALMHKTQWTGIAPGGGFSTPSLAADANLSPIKDGGTMGFGLSFLNDEMGGGKVSSQNVLLGAAYHLKVGEKKSRYRRQRHHLSIGFQGGILSKQIDPTLIFESDLLGGAAEQLQRNTVLNADVRVGAIWSSFFERGRYVEENEVTKKKTNFRVGASYAHLADISETFIQSGTRLQGRITVHGDLSHVVNKKVTINPSFLVASQGAARQYVAGSMIAYKQDKNIVLLAGLHYRVGDATIAVVGVEYNRNVKATLSYDATTSRLTPFNNGRGGLELAIAYTGLAARTIKSVAPQRSYF